MIPPVDGGPLGRLRWLEAIAATGSASASALRVAMILAAMQNQAGELYPSVATIAKRAALTDRGTRKGLRQLVELGFLAVQPSSGGNRTSTNRYTLIHPQPLNHRSPLNDGSPLNSGSATPEQLFREPLNSRSAKHRKDNKGSNKSRSRSSERHLNDMFDRWYEHYPRKVGRGQAQKAFIRLDPSPELVEEMTAAIEQQKEWRARKEAAREWVPEWKHPATWLNSESWLDDTEPSQNVTPVTRPAFPLRASGAGR